MSNAISHKLYTVPEAIYGTTPLTPALSRVRNTGTTLGLTKEAIKSEESDGTRNLHDLRHGNRQVGGEVPFELSYGTFDELFQAVMLGTWSVGGLSQELKVGDARRSFSILRHFADQVAGDKPFHLYNGCELNKLSLKLSPGKIITGSFGIIGRDMGYAATAPTDATYPAVSDTKVIDSFTGSMKVDDVLVAIVTEMTLNVENGLTADFVLFSDKTERPTLGTANISGELGVRFINSAMLEKFLNEQTMSIEFSLQDKAGNDYTFTMPKLVLTGGQPDTAGTGPINLKMPFQAVFDEDTATTMTITRTPYVAP